MSNIPTSPTLPTDEGIVTTQKQFSDALTMDLTDDEISRAFQIMLPIKHKWEERFRRKAGSLMFTVEEAMELVDEFEEELKYELATKLDVYATVDVTPLFEGQPMIIEFQGALPSHSVAKQGFDHEKKTWEVQHATERDEDFYGQKGKQKRKKNARSTRPSTEPTGS